MQGRPRNVWFSGIFRPGGNTKKAAASARSIATADFSVSITNRRIKQYVKTVVPAHKAACPAYVTKRHQSRSSDLDATLALCICLLGFPMTDFRQRGKKHSHPYSDWYRPGFSPDSLFTRHAPSGIADTLCEYSVISRLSIAHHGQKVKNRQKKYPNSLGCFHFGFLNFNFDFLKKTRKAFGHKKGAV